MGSSHAWTGNPILPSQPDNSTIVNVAPIIGLPINRLPELFRTLGLDFL